MVAALSVVEQMAELVEELMQRKGSVHLSVQRQDILV